MMNENVNPIVFEYKKRRVREISVIGILTLITILLGSFLLIYGEKIYSISTVAKVLMGENIQGATFAIMNVRLPKVLAGLLAGMAFGMAGNTFQTLFRNSLASPDIMGVTSGASVAAVFGILVLRLSGNVVSIMAVISGALVAGSIFLLSNGKGFSGGRMILIGIGMQAMLNAVISFLLLKASQYDVASALRWLNGSLNGVRLESIPRLGVIVVLFGSMILLLNRQLKILQLGEELSITLGIRTNIVRLCLILSAVFLVAFATSVTGPIASVAFLAGPISRKITKTGESNTISAGLVGAILVLAGEIVGQNVLATRYPVGVITGIIGAPYLLFLLISLKKEGKYE